LWLDVLLKNLKRIDKKKSQDKIGLPKLDIQNNKKNKINFVNEIYENTIEKESFNIRYLNIENFISI